MAEEQSVDKGFFDKLSWKVLLVVGVITIGILFFAFRQAEMTPSEDDGNFSGPEGYDEYASVNESRGTTDIKGSEVTATVNISEYGTSPARAEIKVGEAVRWNNQNDFGVYIELSGVDENIVLDGGESSAMVFRGMTNYDVYKQSDDFKFASGMVYAE